eukprot:585203-Pelagomonas_calceolata.AAC.2
MNKSSLADAADSIRQEKIGFNVLFNFSVLTLLAVGGLELQSFSYHPAFSLLNLSFFSACRASLTGSLNFVVGGLHGRQQAAGRRQEAVRQAVRQAAGRRQEAGGRRQSGRQSGRQEAGGRRQAGRRAGGRQAGRQVGRQAGGRPGGRQAGGRQAGRRQAGGRKQAMPQARPACGTPTYVNVPWVMAWVKARPQLLKRYHLQLRRHSSSPQTRLQLYKRCQSGLPAVAAAAAAAAACAWESISPSAEANHVQMLPSLPTCVEWPTCWDFELVLPAAGGSCGGGWAGLACCGRGSTPLPVFGLTKIEGRGLRDGAARLVPLLLLLLLLLLPSWAPSAFVAVDSTGTAAISATFEISGGGPAGPSDRLLREGREEASAMVPASRLPPSIALVSLACSSCFAAAL